MIRKDELLKCPFCNGDAWQPIETAPKDGCHILLYRLDIQFVGYYAEAGWVISAPNLSLMVPPPTHWQPLPKPPTGE